MTQTTSRLGLPLLAPGQAQKEITHNEALLLIDMAAQPVVASADLAAPPATPTAGQCWIVAPSPSGAWAGKAGAIAGWTGSGWRFAAPQPGWQAWVADRGQTMRYTGSGWADEAVRSAGYYIGGQQILAARQGAIADPSGGSASDAQARTAIAAILAALRAHGLIEA